jgi:hypothetical protein
MGVRNRYRPKLSHTPERRGLCRWVKRWWWLGAQTVTRRRVGRNAFLGDFIHGEHGDVFDKSGLPLP